MLSLLSCRLSSSQGLRITSLLCSVDLRVLPSLFSFLTHTVDQAATCLMFRPKRASVESQTNLQPFLLASGISGVDMSSRQSGDGWSSQRSTKRDSGFSDIVSAFPTTGGTRRASWLRDQQKDVYPPKVSAAEDRGPSPVYRLVCYCSSMHATPIPFLHKLRVHGHMLYSLIVQRRKQVSSVVEHGARRCSRPSLLRRRARDMSINM